MLDVQRASVAFSADGNFGTVRLAWFFSLPWRCYARLRMRGNAMFRLVCLLRASGEEVGVSAVANVVNGKEKKPRMDSICVVESE